MKAFVRTLVVAPLALFLGCASEEAPPVDQGGDSPDLVAVDEDGVHMVIAYDVDGQLDNMREVASNRREAYMMRFHEDEGVMEAVSCADSYGEAAITASLCHKDFDSRYACSCFVYEVEDDKLFLLPFEEGSTPPSIYDAPAKDISEVTVSRVEGLPTDRYLSGLPRELFGAKPKSVFQVRQKANIVWEAPTVVPPEAPPECSCL